MTADERAVLQALATLVTIDGWASVWSVSQNFDQPIHVRRLEHLVKKWERAGYWEPLTSLSGTFSERGWLWLDLLGIWGGDPVPSEQQFYAAWLAKEDRSPHGRDRNGYYCCLPPEWSHRCTA